MLRRGSVLLLRPTRAYSTEPSVVTRVGFVGLGQMGRHMASNLLKKGYGVTVYDLNSEACEQLKSSGAQVARSPKEVAVANELVVTMLPSSPHVQEVCRGSNGLFAGLREGALVIDSSTIDPAVARSVAAEAKQHNADMLDAPVSGGVLGAENGTLTFMVGGEEAVFNRAKPVLLSMGKNVVHCGANGNGQVVKICNNLAMAIEMIGVSEALNLGIKLGMDAKLLSSIFNTSTSRCWSSDSYNPVPGVLPNVPASRNYTGGFGVDLMAKDLGLAINAAHAIKAPLPLGSVALQVYNLISAHGYSLKDFSSIYDFLQKKTTPQQ